MGGGRWSKGILEFRFSPNLGLRLEDGTKLNNEPSLSANCSKGLHRQGLPKLQPKSEEGSTPGFLDAVNNFWKISFVIRAVAPSETLTTEKRKKVEIKKRLVELHRSTNNITSQPTATLPLMKILKMLHCYFLIFCAFNIAPHFPTLLVLYFTILCMTVLI